MPRYAFIIEPQGEFLRDIMEKKDFVKSVVGDQIYLSHPPHMNLYFNDFPDTGFEYELVEYLRRCERIDIEINGWHIFRNDIRTGGHTLSYRVTNVEDLQRFQLSVVQITSPYRSDGLMEWVNTSSYPPQMRESIEKYGYPYVGSIWIPHFSISSIRKEDFDKIWTELKKSEPKFAFTCKELSLWELNGEEHIPLKRYKIGT